MVENFFGCIKTYCQIACSPTPRQFQTGYSTAILNNLMSSKSICSNCEQDMSHALLDNIDDLISQHNNAKGKANREAKDVYEDVLCEPELKKKELHFLERESLKCSSAIICSKIVGHVSCENCVHILQGDSVNILGEENLTLPSTEFIKMFEIVMDFAIEIIPLFAAEKMIKKIVVQEVKKRTQYESEANVNLMVTLGCVEHSQEVVNDLVELVVSDALILFCKNINALLNGSVDVLPPNPNPIQE